MTARVPRRMPRFASLARHYIGKPYTAALAAAHTEFIAHLGGAQLSHCADVIFGDGEATSGTWRLLVRAGANTRAVVVAIVPYATVGSNPSIQVVGAEGEDILVPRRAIAAVSDLGDVEDPSRYKWTVPVSAGLNEIQIVVNNVRMHSLTCYEVPRKELRGTEIHLDRSIADPRYYLTDAVGGSNPRGVTHLVNLPAALRTNMRRHVFNLPCIAGKTSVAAGPDYLIGSATAADGPRILARDVRGGTTTTTPVRCKVRVSALGAGTWTITYVFPGGTSAAILNVNATGWWPRAGGELVDPGQAGEVAFVDRVKVTATRTGGAGTVTCDSFFVVEDV